MIFAKGVGPDEGVLLEESGEPVARSFAWRRKPMNCKDSRSAFFDFQDGALSAEDKKAVEDHLSKCPSCRAVLAEESKFAEIYREGFAERTRAHPFSADDIRFPARENLASSCAGR